MRVKNIKHGQNEAKNMIKIKKIINDYLYQSISIQYHFFKVSIFLLLLSARRFQLLYKKMKLLNFYKIDK